jgi:hypothetical protein
MIIKEFLPNPIGKDTEGEYIKLLNNTSETAKLDGWKITDLSGKTYTLKGGLGADEELILPYSVTKIALNNDGETLFLYNADNVLIDELSYINKAIEGVVFGKDAGVAGVVNREFLENLIEPLTINQTEPITPKVIPLVLFIIILGVVMALISLWILRKTKNEDIFKKPANN